VLEHTHIHIYLPVDAYPIWLLFVSLFVGGQWLAPSPLTAFFVVVIVSALGLVVVLFIVDPA
jgi:hypothetical protein